MFQKLVNSEGVGLQGLDDLTWNDPLILYLILRKVTKFLVEKLFTSEVISQKTSRGGGGGGGRITPIPH